MYVISMRVKLLSLPSVILSPLFGCKLTSGIWCPNCSICARISLITALRLLFCSCSADTSSGLSDASWVVSTYHNKQSTYIFEPSAVKKGLNTSTESIYQSHPAICTGSLTIRNTDAKYGRSITCTIRKLWPIWKIFVDKQTMKQKDRQCKNCALQIY